MSEAQARFDMELAVMKGVLGGVGYSTALVERPDGAPFDMLVVGLPKDADGRDRHLSLAFLPFELEDLESTKILQFHHVLPFALEESNRAETASLLLQMNQGVALGHYGLKQGTELHLRWVCALPVFEDVDGDWLAEVVLLFTMSADIFSPKVEAVASGRQSAAEALAELGI